jgi:hypothetical protein
VRCLVPLSILRYPLPGIVAAITADAIDGAVFEAFTGGRLANYQHYDKALDIYYLAIAYAAMLRNWTDSTALAIGRLLWFYRLVGVALFAIDGGRTLLFLFPAAFEFFFIFYEVVRVRWNPARLTGGAVLPAAAIASVTLKLPQEYWLHVAQRSTNEWVKERVFGVDPSTPRLEIVAANPWVLAVVAGLAAALFLAGRQAMRWLPPPDHEPAFDANRHGGPSASPVAGRPRLPEPLLGWALAEKLALFALVSIVFAAFLPGVHASATQITLALALIVMVNWALSTIFARRGRRWQTTASEFGVMCAVNAAIIGALEVISLWTDASLSALSALLYVLLLSLLTTLNDRYRQQRAWWAGAAEFPAPVPARERATD